MNFSELDALLIELIVNITKKEREIEIVRQFINELDEFEPFAIFTRIDRNSKKMIISSDIICFLEDNHIIPVEKNKLLINMFIEFYDIKREGGISFDEFLQFIVTKQHSIIRAIATQKPTYTVYKDQFLSEKIENLLTRMINLELEFIDFSDSKKINIQCEKVNYFELFIKLDCNQDAFIDLQDLDTFLRKRNIVLYEEEIMTLILKYDTDMDKKLNFNEYLRFILPSIYSKDIDNYIIEEAKCKYQSFYHIQLKRDKEAKDLGTILSSKEKKIFLNNQDNRLTHISQNYMIESTNEKTYSLNHLTKQSEYLYTNQTNKKAIDNHVRNMDLEKLVYELYTQIKIDKQLENIKQELTLIEEFNLISIFKHFDQRNRDLLSIEDLVWGLNRLGFYPNNDEINIILNKLDQKESGEIKYSNFIELFIPKSNAFAKSLTRRTVNHFELTNPTKSYLVKLFNTFLISENNAKYIKRKFSNDSSFNINNVFKTLDQQRNGYITMNEFSTAFSSFNVEIEIEDLLILMDRYDRNKDGKISYIEFVSEFSL